MNIVMRVISLHGIRTRGTWQKELAPLLAEHGFVPHPLDYGFSKAIGLLIPPLMERRIEWLRTEYERIVGRDPGCRPSIIAHSFGTWLVANLIKKYRQVKFDKVILTGSIVEREFDWLKVIADGQVNYLRNDYGSKDLWPKVASHLVHKGGASGTIGFTCQGPLIQQQAFQQYSHSTCFNELHFTNEWIPVLKQLVLHIPPKRLSFLFDEDTQKSIVEFLNLAVMATSSKLGIDTLMLRANIFIESEVGRLRIPPNIHYNMRNKGELDLRITVGQGCTGQAYSTQRRAYAVLGADWGNHALPDEQLQLVHKDLRWVISTPIPMQLNGGTQVIGIFNLDCLKETKTRQQLSVLEEAEDDLLATAQLIGKVFAKGAISWGTIPNQ